MRKHKKSIMAFSLAFVMLTSCGNHFDAPPLEDPVSVVEPYYTVTRGNVGKIEVAEGVISAKPYCQFWKTQVGVQEIKVELGQFVKAGDVVAVADYEMAQRQNTEIQNQISRIQSIYNQTSKRYDVMEEEYNLTLKGAKKLGDTATEKEMKANLKELEECRKYDKALCGIRVSACNKEMEELQKVMKDTNLVADHDGYVTYVKDIDANNMVSKEDNVVIISDYNDTYIETKDAKGARIKPFETIYITDNGVRHDLKEIEYSENELMIASNKQLTITRRYVYEDGGKLPEVGKMVYIVQKHQSADNVIVIDKNYIFEDEEGTFVYVMKDGVSEKRYITIGESDTNKREVKSGLEEGEKVFAKDNPIMPSQYTEVEAKYGSLVMTEMNNKLLIDDRKSDVQKFYGRGTVSKIVTDGERVKKGEVICSISTDEGAAILNEMQVNMARVREGHENEVEMIDANIKELKKQINALKDEKKASSKESGKKSESTTEAKKETPTTEIAPESEGANNQVEDKKEKQAEEVKGAEEAVSSQDIGFDDMSARVEILAAELEEATETTQDTETTTEMTETETEATTETTTATEATTEVTTEAITEAATEATTQVTEQMTEATTEDVKKEQNTADEKKDKTEDASKNKKPEEKPTNPYQKEILECQIQELEIDKTIAQIDYSYTAASMERSYNEMLKGNDGSGEKKFIAQEDCVIRKTYCSRGDRVDYGSRIFSIVQEGNPKVLIKNKDHYALNQAVNIVVDGDTRYKGKIISDNSYSGNYLTTKDGEVFVTYNAEGSEMNYYMASEDKNLYTDTNQKSAKIVIGDYNGVVVLPARAVYDTTRNGKEAVIYVWKKVGDSWNMQIITAVYMQIEDTGYYAVLDGVNVGDTLAMQE